MPWIKYTSDERPDHYRAPNIVTACAMTDADCEYAIKKRAEAQRHYDELITKQKQLKQDGRELKPLIQEAKKQKRGWDIVCAWVLGQQCNPCQEEIAPYADAAFWDLHYSSYPPIIYP